MEFSDDIFGNLIRKSRHRSKELEVRPISTQTEESQKLGLEERLQMIDQGNVLNKKKRQNEALEPKKQNFSDVMRFLLLNFHAVGIWNVKHL